MEDNNSNQLNQDPQGVVLDANDAVQKHEVINPFVTPSSYSHKSKNLTLWTTIAAILVLIFIAVVGYILVKSQKSTLTTDNKPNTSKQDLSVVGLDQLNLGQLGQLDVNGIIKVNNGIVLKPATQPESPLLGQIYLNNTTKQLAYYDGEVFQTLATPTNSVSSIGGVSGAISLGAGLTLQGNTLSAEVINNTNNSAGVTSVQGQSGAVLLVGGPGITVSGTKISNAGVTKLGGRTGSISAGRGISLSGNTLLSTVSLSSASATLVVTDDGNGNYTISQIGSGSSGSVALGPAVAQTDASNFPSISVDKTGIGNLIEFSVGGVNRFVVGQGGAITTGAIGFSQITGLPQIVNNFTDGSSNTATGAITLGSGLALSGNTIINTATGGITAVNGTANQVNSSTSLGVVTLSLPQDINTNSTPQFSGITLTGLGNGIVQSSSGVLSGGSVDRNSGTLFTNQLSVANGGTGSNSASGARTNLGAAASGANSDITSLSGLTTALSVGQGGTGSTSLSQNGVLIGNGSGAISSVVAGGSGLCLTSTAGAPAWAACPGSGGVSSVNTFTGAVVIQGTTNQVTVSNNTGTITLSLPQDINTTSSPQFSSMTLTSTLAVQGASATIGGVAQGGSLILNDGSTNTATILSAALGQNVVYTLPDPGQATATICLSTGNCAGAGAGVTTGGGTSGRIPVFTAAQNIEDSTLSQSGSIITASGSVVVQGALGVTLGTNNSVDGIATFNNDSGTHTVSLQAPNADPASNLVFRLPSADGASGNCLKTDSFGVLSFGSCLSGAGGGSGGVISLNGLSGNLSLANASGSGSTVTIDDATTLAKGIASFSSSFFTVSSGAVSLATGSVTSNEIANATITGTDIANSTVANTNLVNSSLSVNAGTGLSGGGSVALGASTSLSVSYGGSSGTAVEGNTILTCPSGAGNLTGGGTSITLGNGGTCADLNTVANPTFLTSVTTAEYIFTGAGNNASLKIGNLGQVTTYTLPDPGGASATICLNTGNCAGSGGGVTTAGGTTNAIAKFTGSQTLGDSSISDNGTTVTVGVNLNVSGAVTLSNELTVGNGGTGATTFTSNGILYGNGTGALQATAAGATGECLIGNTGAAPSWGSCAGAAGGVSSLNTFTGGVTVQGTANQVVVSNNTGTITLSLPQSINTSSSPQFTNLTLSGNLTVQGGTGTFGTTTQAGSLVVYDGTSNTGTIQTAALGQNTSYTLPDPGGASATICLSTGNCAGAGSGVTTPGGTTNAIPKFTGSQTLGDSSISDNGSVVTTSGDLAVNGGDITSTAGTLTINAGGAVDIQDGVTVDSLTADTGNVNIASGVLQTAGTTRITNSGVLQNVTNADASTFFTGGSLTVARGGTGAGTFTANGVIYGNGTSALGVTAAGTTGQCLIATTGAAPSWGSCAGAGSGSTLQAAYDNGNTITTSDARNINFTLANSTTDSNFVVQVADDSTGYASISRVDGAGTNDPAQLLLIDNLDTNRAVGVGLRLQAAAGGLTVGIDVSDNEIVTGLALGTNDVTVNGVTVGAAEFALLDGRDGALVDTNDAVATAITGTGALNAGSITSGFGTIDNADTITGTTLNGTTGINSGAGAGTQRIDASGNLVNIGDAAINGGDVTSTAATLVINAGGNVDIQDAATVDSLTADTGNVAITSGALTTAGTTRLTNGGALQNITGFSQTSGTFATSGITSFSVDGTATATYALGASATSGTIAIGGAAQTGTITLGQSTDSNTINIGNAATAAGKTQTINIGTGGSGTSTTSISIGSTTGGTTYLYGNTYLANLNSANNANYLCQNSFGYLASCNTTGTGAAFVQGGNSFGATATLGTNDSNSLTFETNNATQATIAVGGGTTFKNSADSNTAFRIQNTSSNNFLLVDTLGSSISIGDTGIASTIQIGNTTGAIVQTINVGNNGTASSSSNVVIGSTIGGTTTLQSQAGTIISTLGAADNTNYLCRNTSNIIATCNAASITLQGAYDGDADGSDSVITLSTADDGIIIRNPSSSGSDSTYNLVLDQLSTGAKGGLSIQSAGTGNLLLVTDTTATARDVFTIADGGAATFRNQTDNESAFSVKTAGGSAALNVNTSLGTGQLFVINSGLERLGNVLQNPGFEASVGALSTSDFGLNGWLDQTGDGTVVNDAVNSNTGYRYLRAISDSTTQTYRTKYYNVVAGQDYYAEGYVKNTAGTNGTGFLRLRFYDKDFNGLQNSDSSTALPGTSYTLRSVRGTAPANAVFVQVQLIVAAGSTAGEWHWDDVYLNNVNEVSPQLFKNSSDSTVAFAIQNAGGSSLLTADTTNLRLTSGGDLNIGTTFGSRLFSDDFESGSFDKWSDGAYSSGSSTAAISTAQAHNGKYSSLFTENGCCAAAYSTIKSSTTAYARAYFYVTSSSSGSMRLMALSNGTNNVGQLMRNQSTGNVEFLNGTTSTTTGSGVNMPLNQWVKLEMRVTIGSGTGVSTVWMNDTQIVSLTGQNNGTTNLSSIMIGNENSPVGTYYVDDVSVDTAQTGNSVNVNISDSLHVAGTSSFGNNVLIQSASDNTAAFQVQNAAGTNQLTVDTTNSRVDFGNSAGTNYLRISTTNGSVYAQNSSAFNSAFSLQQNGDSNARYSLYYTGGQEFGSGSSARDIAFNRSAAGTLQIYSPSNVGPATLQIRGSTAQSTTDLFQVQTSTPATVFSVGATGAVLSKNSTDSTTAFQIQNANSGSLLSVDATFGGNLTVLGNNSAEVGVWATNSNSITARRAGGSVVANGYVYYIGGYTGAGSTGESATVQYAKINANGSLGTFNTTTSLNTVAALISNSVVYANGYIYVVGGDTGSYATTVQYAPVNPDGTLGTWQTTSSLPAARASGGAIVRNGYVYYIGGFSSGTTAANNVYYAKLNADGTIGTWQTNGSNQISAVGDDAVVTANGYIYVVGGYNSGSGGSQTSVQSAAVNNDGSTGTWGTTTTIPARDSGGAVLVNGYIYFIGGNSGGSDLDDVYYAAVGTNGSVGSWTNATNQVPVNREYAGVVTANGYIYSVGGAAAGAATSGVYYTNTPRLTLGGSLDLVGLSGESLYENSSGGSLTAGNTNVIGTLNVQGASTHNGNLSVNGDATFKAGTNSTSSFTIQNASGASLLNSDTTNLDITVGGNLLVSKASQANQDWTKVSGTAGTIGGNATTAIDRAYSSAVYNGSLYIGTNKTGAAEIYRYDGSNLWTKVSPATAGTIGTAGTPTPAIDEIRSMVVYNGSLYAGTAKSNSAEVYRYDGGTTWTKVTQTTAGTIAASGTASIDKASRMVVYNGSLYMGTDENNSAEIYRYDGGTTWTRVSFDATHIQTGSTATIDAINGFAILNNQLFVAAGDGSNTAGTGAEIYRYDGGSTWTSITPAVGSFGTGVTNVNFVYGITAYNGSLYVGTNDTAANVAEIVRYDGGVGASAVWTKVSQSSAGTIASGGTSNVDGIAKLIVYNGKMYASTFSSNIGEVYRYDGGTTWVKISQTTAGTIAAGGTANIDSVYNLEVYNGSLYAGTGETGAAEVYRYSDNIIEGRSSDTAGVFNLGASGTVNFQNSTNSTTAFNIQNTAGDNLFTVDSTNAGNITLLGNNGAAVGAWTTNSNNLTSGTLNAGITYANGYVYVVGGNSSGISTKVEYAKVNANGSIGTFATTTSLPTARDDLQAVVSNGYIYALGGTTSGAAGGAVTTVNYAKLNADGTVGNWGTTSSLPSGRYTSSAVVYNGYIYMVAGSDTSTAIGTTAYAKINADGSLGAWTVSGNAFPSGNVRRAPSVVVANGYLYSMAGQSGSGAGSGKSDVYYSRIASDGSIGAWSTATSMPGGRSWGGAAVSNGYIYYYGGYDGSADQEEVYYAQLNSDGSLGSWNTNATGMNTSEADFGWFSTNGYIYALGIGTSNAQVQYTSTARVSIGGNLDLVGISGENLAEGGSGGSLTAGNTSIIGTLNVQDQANFQQSLDVGGTLTVHGGIYSGQDIKIDRRTNSGGTSSDWVVTNSTAGTIGSQTLINSVESMAVYNGSLYIGTYDSSGNSAEVYRYDENDGTYTLVSSSGFGNSVERIQSMLVYNGYLYAGTQKTNGAQIFRYDGGTTWTNVSGTAGTIGGNDTNVDGVYGMAVWHGKMYIGTFASGGVGEVYRYDGGSIWADLIGTAGNICGTGGNDYVHELEVFQDQLYAATFGGADICRYNGGTSWTRVNAASGQIATGGTSGIQGVESMAVFNGALYAGTYNDDGLGAGHAEIYRYDGGNAGEWVKVSNTTAGTIASGGTSSIDIVATLMPYNGKLYAGTWGSSGSNPDKAEVYVFDPVANSWSKVSYTTAGKITSSGTANINGVIQMQVYNDKLYAATGEANSSEIYKFSAVYDQSYSLRFSAASSAVTGTEQGSYFNEGSIYFSAGLQGTNTNDYSQTGSFVFSHGITTATGSYDVAEDYPTRDGLLSTGDVVTIDPDETGFVKRSDEKMQSTIVGVYSEKPALRLGQKDTTINGGIAIPVALAGRVPVKVSLENGPIKPGDFLTSSSTPGYAMKATEAGPSLGKALGSFDGTNGSEGKVLAFVNVSYYAPPTGSTLQANQTMDGNLYVQGSGTFAGDLNVGGKATIGSLKVSGDSTFEGDVAVIGSLTTQTLTVEGHIITGGEVPTIDVLQTGIQASDITVVGNDTSGTISINVPAAEILTEGDLVKLIFAKAYNKTPKVVISPIGVNSAKLGAYVDQKQTEFVLGVSTPPPTDASYKFNYFIVE